MATNSIRIVCNRDTSVHAEVAACYKATDLINATIYVVRINNAGDFADSRPCCKCMEFLKKKKIGKVFYSNSDGTLGLIKFSY